ncbi:unnamed protein product [Adineta ricciae]|uniref:NAD(P)(+)--arginine ADP-ribosyltransferase n=1 Tax=Adineta ricciae TaxID=249248 RepID=A0A815DMJ5_ADIRI|nr:unnamed protein product [Adineta ricciae]CAF1649122.1 unnamed protein product [Adineta ricciae]
MDKRLLYRAINLSDEQIAMYKECVQNPDEYQTFQTSTSTSRSRTVAELIDTNDLFIMRVNCAFTADIQPYSIMPHEEEKLINPGVSFTVKNINMNTNTNTNKNVIYLQPKQHFNKAAIHEISNVQAEISADNSSTFRDFPYKGILGILVNDPNRVRRLDRNGFDQSDPLLTFFSLSRDGGNHKDSSVFRTLCTRFRVLFKNNDDLAIEE